MEPNEEMKRPERLKLVEDIKKHVLQMAPHQQERHTAVLLRESAVCIEQLESELDAIHENFLRHQESLKPDF